VSLIAKAQAVAQTRDSEYPDWKETAHRFEEGDPTAYPLTMIRAKLARDPDCRREDTRVDLVNYLAMLDELYPADEPITTVEQIAVLKARDVELGCEL
jgi:hypothetical protein